MQIIHRALIAACAFVCASWATNTALAQSSPPARPTLSDPYAREPVGQQFVGNSMPMPELKAQYPNKVEVLYDLTYARLVGYRQLTLDLYHVPGTGRKPAIVFVHGGSFLSGGPRERHPLWGTTQGLMAYIAAQGFVAVPITYRLASEAKWPAQLEDIKAAVRWLRANAAKYGIDPQHIGVWGESAGGGAAAMAGTTCGVTEFDGEGGNQDQSSCVQAAIDWYGVSDMNQLDAQAASNATLIHNSPDSSQSKVLGCVLHFTCPASVVNKANPLAYVGAKTTSAAFLIMHGGDDKAVSWKQAQILYDALQAKGLKTKLDVVPEVDHYFVGATAEQAKKILDETVQFLQENLSSK